jgi:hypothetical protein
MIHFYCPDCGAKRSKHGFRIRGQWCMCGWFTEDTVNIDEEKDTEDDDGRA